MIDQRIVACDQHAELESEALYLGQDVQEQLVVVQRLLSCAEGHALGQEVVRRQPHPLRNLIAVPGVGLHQGLDTALAVVEGRKNESPTLPSTKNRQSLGLERVGPHGVVDAVPFDRPKRHIRNRASFPSGNDLGGA